MSNKTKNSIVLIVLVVVALGAGVGAMISRSGEGKILRPVDHLSRFASKDIASFPSPLHVQGNQIQNEAGQPVLLRGLAAVDPAVLMDRKQFDVQFLVRMHDAGANAVRIPVQPQNWVNDPDYMWRYLGSVSDWAGKMGMYVIVDWDVTGDPATGAGIEVDNLKALPKDLTLEFWRQNARYFRTAPNVIFEIFDRPVGMTAEAWQSSAAGIVTAIREQEFQNLVLVSGVDGAKDLSWALANPIQDGNLAYAVQVYPSQPQADWAVNFGDVAAKVPVVVTGWGFMDENRSADLPDLAGDRAGYAVPLLDTLNEKHIGWVATWYDSEWTPPMFTGSQKATGFGQFVLNQLEIPAAP